MTTPAAILAVLDALAENFQFPGFNNMNYDMADVRLHGYHGPNGWALLVEELVDWPGAEGLTRIVFAMGDRQGEELKTFSPIDAELDCDPDSGETVVPDEVFVRGQGVAIDRAALDATCEEHGVASSFALLLQLIASQRDALFSTKEELQASVAEGLERVIVLDDWAHPDVYGGPSPSQSEAFQQLAEVLSTGDVSYYAPTEPPNSRDWKMWLASR